MKKLFIALVISIFALNCSAQWNEWYTEVVQGDELKGTTSYTANHYNDSYGNSITICSDNGMALLHSKNILNYEYSGTFKTIKVTVGLYEGETLINKYIIVGGVLDNLQAAYFPGDGHMQDVYKHIMNGGKARFILPCYSGPDFDITVPEFKLILD